MYQFNVPTFGKGVVFDVDSKIRAEQFKFFASALQSSKLKSYIPLFAKESEVKSDHGLLPWLDLIRFNGFASLVKVSCLSCSHDWYLMHRCMWQI